MCCHLLFLVSNGADWRTLHLGYYKGKTIKIGSKKEGRNALVYFSWHWRSWLIVSARFLLETCYINSQMLDSCWSRGIRSPRDHCYCPSYTVFRQTPINARLSMHNMASNSIMLCKPAVSTVWPKHTVISYTLQSTVTPWKQHQSRSYAVKNETIACVNFRGQGISVFNLIKATAVCQKSCWPTSNQNKQGTPSFLCAGTL